jgi:uncharacterized protein (TIGR03067 family)
MVSAERDGQPLPASFVESSRRIAKDDEVTVMVNGRVFLSARVELDSSKSPKQIDYGLANGKMQLGIYDLEGSRLAFCFGRPGAERPRDFSAGAGTGRTFSAWRRDP